MPPFEVESVICLETNLPMRDISMISSSPRLITGFTLDGLVALGTLDAIGAVGVNVCFAAGGVKI